MNPTANQTISNHEMSTQQMSRTVRPNASQVVKRSGRHLVRMYLTELRLFARESHVWIFVFGFPVITVVVLGGVFGTETNDSGFEFVNPSHFYATAYFGVVLAAIGLIMVPTHVASYRERGVLRRYDTSGFARWVFPAVQYLCGLTVAGLGFITLTGTAVMTSGMPEMARPAATAAGSSTDPLSAVSSSTTLGAPVPNCSSSTSAAK